MDTVQKISFVFENELPLALINSILKNNKIIKKTECSVTVIEINTILNELHGNLIVNEILRNIIYTNTNISTVTFMDLISNEKMWQHVKLELVKKFVDCATIENIKYIFEYVTDKKCKLECKKIFLTKFSEYVVNEIYEKDCQQKNFTLESGLNFDPEKI